MDKGLIKPRCGRFAVYPSNYREQHKYFTDIDDGSYDLSTKTLLTPKILYNAGAKTATTDDVAYARSFCYNILYVAVRAGIVLACQYRLNDVSSI